MTGKIYVVPSGRKPIYKQLTEHFQKDIRMGILSPGDMLPSMNDLSRATGIPRKRSRKPMPSWWTGALWSPSRERVSSWLR
ncbi:MAG: GntR family transcriptional regulator [Bacteroidales bacterium]|nr:GntR family transcriptional regulator [Bacteroidales bacterium]